MLKHSRRSIVLLALLASACSDTDNTMRLSSAAWDKAWQTVYVMNSEAKAAEASSTEAKHTTAGPRM